MLNEDKISKYKLSRSDTLRFRSIVIDTMSEAASLDATDRESGIGTLGEKQMHAAIKQFICPDEGCHEVRLDCEESNRDGEEKTKRRRFVADILKDGTVYEIQTGRLAPLHDKIAWVIENTDYNITVIHPIAESKWVNVLDKNNEIEKRYRSPVKGKISDMACELFSIADFVASPRFSLVLLLVEAEQYMKNTAKTSRTRPKFKKYELIPINLLSAAVFSCLDDYKYFIPDLLNGEFTVKQYSNESKIRGMDAYTAVHSLCSMGLLENCGKIGRAAAYRRTF